jgi:hypothetical protein
MQLEQFRYALGDAVEKIEPSAPQIRMNELIKKLKGSGFSLRHGDIEIEGIRYDLPSLEELTEACPTNIGKATFVLGSANQGKEWIACYSLDVSCWNTCRTDIRSSACGR